ncbi:hypothetical protein ScPMuIL_018396 [Solemya velum]
MPGGFQGCTRGVFGLHNWKTPLRRPKVWMEEGPVSSNSSDPQEFGSPSSMMSDPETPTSPVPNFKPGDQVMIKYSYKANSDSPLGKELSVNQKENAYFVSMYKDSLWIKVRNEQGEEGYIPTSYVMVLEANLNNLPWLNSIETKKITQQEAEWKPYKSAYAADTGDETKNMSNYYCSVCAKQLNGPQPYSAHMVSKSHKEEVAAQAEYS